MRLFQWLRGLVLGLAPSFAACDVLQIVETPDAPKALGAYSQGIIMDPRETHRLVFVSGQVPLDPKSGKMVEGDIHLATNQALDNVEAILKAAGSDWEHVIRVDVFLQHFDRDWDGMNEEYKKRFPRGVFPVRQTVGVQMDSDTLVEISCVAVVPRVRKPWDPSE